MLKKILTLCVLLCSFVVMGSTTSEAAAKIKDMTWGVNKQNMLRIVLDTTIPAKAKIKKKGMDLIITVKAEPPSSRKMKRYVPPNSTNIRYIVLEKEDNDETVLRINLKKDVPAGQYKLFNLPKNVGANRPPRVVFDIPNGVLRKEVATNNNKGETVYKKIIPTYQVAGGIRGKRITLDPGHGGSDPGCHGIKGTQEKDVTLPISMKVKELLEKKGAIVSMTRTTDVDVYGPDATDRQELQARVDVAENNKADLFVSLHINASPNREIGGFSTYYNPKTRYDYTLAECIQKSLMKTSNLEDLGVRQANFYVNKRSSMPGALAELLFLSNPREEKLLRSNWFRNKIAAAVADGIEDFYKKM